jgi:hypothetical protein
MSRQHAGCLFYITRILDALPAEVRDQGSDRSISSSLSPNGGV